MRRFIELCAMIVQQTVSPNEVHEGHMTLQGAVAKSGTWEKATVRGEY